MKRNFRIVLSSIWVVIGAILIALAFAGKVDSFWNGLGTGLLVVGVLNLLRIKRLTKDAEYRENMEIEENDERNKFLRNQSLAWSGYAFILIAAISSIVLKALDQELLAMAASSAVCLMLVLYWISYLILKKKY